MSTSSQPLTLTFLHTQTHTHTSLTLAECTIHLLLVLWDCRSAWGCQFSLPQCLRIFGAPPHFLVVQLHLADVQLISARCNTSTRTKRDERTHSTSFLSMKTLLSHQKIKIRGQQKKKPLCKTECIWLKDIRFECGYSPSHHVTCYHGKPTM